MHTPATKAAMQASKRPAPGTGGGLCVAAAGSGKSGGSAAGRSPSDNISDAVVAGLAGPGIQSPTVTAGRTAGAAGSSRPSGVTDGAPTELDGPRSFIPTVTAGTAARPADGNVRVTDGVTAGLSGSESPQFTGSAAVSSLGASLVAGGVAGGMAGGMAGGGVLSGVGLRGVDASQGSDAMFVTHASCSTMGRGTLISAAAMVNAMVGAEMSVSAIVGTLMGVGGVGGGDTCCDTWPGDIALTLRASVLSPAGAMTGAVVGGRAGGHGAWPGAAHLGLLLGTGGLTDMVPM